MMIGILMAASAQALAPVPNMTNDWWSPVYDTPGRGLAPGEISFVIAEMTVNTRGKVTDCVGKVYLGNPQMGAYVCSRLRMRASFDPARDPSGQKVMGVFRKVIINANISSKDGKFSFRSPNTGIVVAAPKEALSNNPLEIQFYVDAAGAVSDCTLVRSIGINLMRTPQVVESALVEDACRQVAAKLKPAPARDKGQAVPSAQNAIVLARTEARPSN